jgi:predicted acetyltransferase
LAVDLLHKKEKIALELMKFFLDHYLKKGVCLAALYPFRPDFYRQMGFGYGTKLCRYRFRPGDLPRADSKKHLQYLSAKDIPAIFACYNRYVDATHGMFAKIAVQKRRYRAPGIRMIGYRRGRRLEGYLTFVQKPGEGDNPVINDINIEELVWEHPGALKELLAFLRSQHDQVRYIHYTTPDDSWHYLPFDPRRPGGGFIPPLAYETNVAGVGIMYRVLSTAGLFSLLKHRDFAGESLKLRLSIRDNLLSENNGGTIVHFVDGKPRHRKTGPVDVEVAVDVSDFSSLILGAVDFESLYQFGLAEVSKPRYVERLRRLFAVEHRPRTSTQF